MDVLSEVDHNCSTIDYLLKGQAFLTIVPIMLMRQLQLKLERISTMMIQP